MDKKESKYFQTAIKLEEALISLLNIKDFEYITVKDICLKAKVNRSTFYLHYLNVNDLLEDIVFNLNKSFISFMGKDNKVVINNNLEDLYLISDQYLLPYLLFIKENKNVYKALKSNPHLFKADKQYEEMFNNLFSPIMTQFGLDIKFHKYLMDFFINGISTIVLDWVNDDCKYEINEIAELIKGLIVKYEGKNK